MLLVFNYELGLSLVVCSTQLSWFAYISTYVSII